MAGIPTPRLLPTTIAALGSLLVIKCGVLAMALLSQTPFSPSGMFAIANAADADQAPEAAKPKPARTPGTLQTQQAPGVAKATPEAAPAPVSPSEKLLLQQLGQRRKDLDAKASSITTRESVLTAAEQRLASQIGDMQALQKRLEVLNTEQKQKEDAGWQGLVKMYEAMKPKDAATIFNELSMPVLLQVLDRMKDTKAASIMAAMSPERARDVTAELAQMRTGHDPSAAENTKRTSMAN